jgi:hypothetical protein
MDSLQSSADRWNTITRSAHPYVLTLTNWTILSALLTLLYRTVATRLFKPYSMLIFKLLSEDRRDWQVDQLRVAIVNSGGPLGVLLLQPVWRTVFGGLRRGGVKRARERWVAVIWWVGGLVFSIAPLTVPFIMTRAIPSVSGVPGSVSMVTGGKSAADQCAGSVAFLPDTPGNPNARYDTLLALDMLRQADSYGFNYSATSAQSVGLNMTKDRVFLSANCPEWAPVCDQTNPLRVDVDYWLRLSDLKIGVDKEAEDVEFGVLNTCYKVESHTKYLYEDGEGDSVYGLMYGGDGIADFPNVTAILRRQEVFGSGYSVRSYFNATGLVDSTGLGWAPNDTMAHDGDLSLLIYHLGAVHTIGFSSADPLFATKTPPLTFNNISIYQALKITVPIMCNTSFSICHTNKPESCDLISGMMALTEYADAMDAGIGSAIKKGFLQLMGAETGIPLLAYLADTSDSVLASQTLEMGTMQPAPGWASGHAEIVRLVLAGRMKLATAAVRASSNWYQYAPSMDGILLYTGPALQAMCTATLIEDSAYITTSLFPLLAILGVGILAILLTFTGPIWRRLFWKHLGVFTMRWRLRGVGQLHRTTVEGEASWGKVVDEWPEGKAVVAGVGLVGDEVTGYWAGYGKGAVLMYKPRELIL